MITGNNQRVHRNDARHLSGLGRIVQNNRREAKPPRADTASIAEKLSRPSCGRLSDRAHKRALMQFYRVY